MTSTLRSLVVRSFLVIGFALGAVQGCGSSGSSTPSCMESCVKALMCEVDASTASADTLCSASCAQGAAGSSGQGTKCTNQSAIDSAGSSCFSMSDCTAFNNCLKNIPPCQMAGTGGTNGAAGTNGSAGKSGGAGASGAAGSTGAGGAGATADCSVCDKANTCCQALAALVGQSTASCTYSTATCNGEPASAQPSYANVCQTILTDGAAASSSCK
jgi:hypothetical protein